MMNPMQAMMNQRRMEEMQRRAAMEAFMRSASSMQGAANMLYENQQKAAAEEEAKARQKLLDKRYEDNLAKQEEIRNEAKNRWMLERGDRLVDKVERKNERQEDKEAAERRHQELLTGKRQSEIKRVKDQAFEVLNKSGLDAGTMSGIMGAVKQGKAEARSAKPDLVPGTEEMSRVEEAFVDKRVREHLTKTYLEQQGVDPNTMQFKAVGEGEAARMPQDLEKAKANAIKAADQKLMAFKTYLKYTKDANELARQQRTDDELDMLRGGAGAMKGMTPEKWLAYKNEQAARESGMAKKVEDSAKPAVPDVPSDLPQSVHTPLQERGVPVHQQPSQMPPQLQQGPAPQYNMSPTSMLAPGNSPHLSQASRPVQMTEQQIAEGFGAGQPIAGTEGMVGPLNKVRTMLTNPIPGTEGMAPTIDEINRVLGALGGAFAPKRLTPEQIAAVQQASMPAQNQGQQPAPPPPAPPPVVGAPDPGNSMLAPQAKPNPNQSGVGNPVDLMRAAMPRKFDPMAGIPDLAEEAVSGPMADLRWAREMEERGGTPAERQEKARASEAAAADEKQREAARERLKESEISPAERKFAEMQKMVDDIKREEQYAEMFGMGKGERSEKHRENARRLQEEFDRKYGGEGEEPIEVDDSGRRPYEPTPLPDKGYKMSGDVEDALRRQAAREAAEMGPSSKENQEVVSGALKAFESTKPKPVKTEKPKQKEAGIGDVLKSAKGALKKMQDRDKPKGEYTTKYQLDRIEKQAQKLDKKYRKKIEKDNKEVSETIGHQLEISSTKRGKDDPLTLANPKSYHPRGEAHDIPASSGGGMTLEQFKRAAEEYGKRGYTVLVEAGDQVKDMKAVHIHMQPEGTGGGVKTEFKNVYFQDGMKSWDDLDKRRVKYLKRRGQLKE